MLFISKGWGRSYMNKKAVQIIVMVFIAIMFIATVVITIVLKPTNHDANIASSEQSSSISTQPGS